MPRPGHGPLSAEGISYPERGTRYATLGFRDRDPLDLRFLRPTPDLAAQIHTAFKPPEWDDLGLFESLTEGDLYTFAGYPVSRATVRGHRYESERFKYTPHPTTFTRASAAIPGCMSS